MNRASPSQQRKALEIAHLFVKMGVGFVPMPVKDGADFEKLAQESIERLLRIATAQDAAHQASAPTGGQANE